MELLWKHWLVLLLILIVEVPQFIPTTHLIKAIAALKGVDQRTIKKYLKLLEGFGCIKKSGMGQYEFG